MADAVVTPPPPEVVVADFIAARKLEAWQVRAFLARFNLRPDSMRPLADLERDLDVALLGGI